MSLSPDWVDRIFDKLTVTYGQQFLRRWQDIDMNAVKSDWAYELAGFQNHGKAIAYALNNLPPERPPSVLEFRAIARRVPDDEQPKLELAAASKERIEAELQRLGPIAAPERGRGLTLEQRFGWAHRIVARHKAGGNITRVQLAMANEAIEIERGLA